MGMSTDVAEYMLGVFIDSLVLPFPLENNDNRLIEIIRDYDLLRKQNKNLSMVKLLETISLPSSAYFLTCKFGEQVFNCSDRLSSIFTNFGKCFLLKANSSDEFFQTKPGPGGGMSFFLQYSKDKIASLDSGQMHGVGFLVTVLDGFSPILWDPIMVPVGRLSFLRINAEKVVRNSRCTDAPYNKLLNGKEKNNLDMCQYEIFLEKSLANCGCAPLTYKPKLKESQICDPWQTISCVKPLFDKRFGVGTQSCLPPCTTMQHTHSLVVVDFNRERFARKLKMKEPDFFNISAEKMDELLHVHVFFDAIGVKVTEEYNVATWSTILSSFGGQMGLWLGTSVFTASVFLVEIVGGKWRKKITKEYSIHDEQCKY